MSDQLDKLTDFIAITGSDTDSAKQYLEFADYDLESAVTLFLEGGGGGTAASALAAGHGTPGARSAAGTHGAPRATGHEHEDEEFEDEDAALSRRLQEEEYQAAAASVEERVRDTIAPVRETLVEPEYRKYFCFQQELQFYRFTIT